MKLLAGFYNLTYKLLVMYFSPLSSCLQTQNILNSPIKTESHLIMVISGISEIIKLIEIY